jgi:hypothetical protein
MKKKWIYRLNLITLFLKGYFLSKKGQKIEMFNKISFGIIIFIISVFILIKILNNFIPFLIIMTCIISILLIKEVIRWLLN